MACSGHLDLGPLACSANLQPSQALSLATDPGSEKSAVVINGSPAMVETIGPDLTTHQGLSIALQQEAIWGDAGSFSPFGVQHCTWSPSGLRAFAPWWTQSDELPPPPPKTSGSMAQERSRDGWAACLSTTVGGHGMESIAQEPKHRAFRRRNLSRDQCGVGMVLLELHFGGYDHQARLPSQGWFSFRPERD